MNKTNVVKFNPRYREFNRLIKYLQNSSNDNVFYLFCEYTVFILLSREGTANAFEKAFGICNKKAELLVHTMVLTEDGEILGFHNSHQWAKNNFIKVIEWLRDNPDLTYTDMLGEFNSFNGTRYEAV